MKKFKAQKIGIQSTIHPNKKNSGVNSEILMKYKRIKWTTIHYRKGFASFLTGGLHYRKGFASFLTGGLHYRKAFASFLTGGLQ